MAENIAFKITVDTDVADLSVGELKQAFKDLTTEINTTQVGTDKYKQTLTKLGDVKGALKDVKEQINALDPEKKFRAIAQVGSSIASGFAAAQGAVALFGGESEDLQKVLVRVQAATALASGLQGLTGFSKALQTAGLAMKAFAMSNPFTAIAAAVVALVAVVATLIVQYQEANSETAKLERTVTNLNEAYEKQAFLLNEEIKILTAYGDKQDEVIKKKRELLKVQAEQLFGQLKLAEANVKEAESISILDGIRSRFQGTGFIKKRTEEAKAEVDVIKKKIEEIKTAMTVNFIEEDKLIEGNEKEKKKKAAERKKELLKEDQDFYQRYILDVHGQNFRTELELAEQAKRDKQALKDEELDFFNRYILQVAIANNKQAKKDIELARMVKDAKLSLASQTFGVIGDLAMAFAGENEKGAKRAFEINKAASIAQAIISTYQGANAIFANAAANPSTVLFPAQPFITAGIAIASGLANVAKIAKTQFKSSDTGGGGGGATGSVNAPNLQSPQTANNNAVTISQRGVNEDQQGNFAGFQQPIKAYVVETEMTSAQKTIQSIEQRTTF